ncbi:MAG TPA: hypothetical protein VF894_14715 [Anaeromyxobacter sp.]
MPPKGVKSQKRKRQYEHIKRSIQSRGGGRAKEIAARVVNKQRRRAGETKTRGRRTSKSGSSRRRATGTRRRSH